MNWPTHTDYQDSIQNPHICFEVDTLTGGEVGCDMLGLPKVTSGNFACVYSLTTDDGRFAIRCFVRQVLGQQGRYARLAQHLMGLGLNCMVDFEYILRGIKVANEWYPILKMNWVDGLPLNQYMEEYLDDNQRLRSLVDKFPEMIRELRHNDLAHCDLQHGNIMVTPEGEFKLVDYDGMFTQAFRGKSPELGHANFQHPRRTPDFYNEHVDNFGALVCYLSLMAVAENPDLFKKYYAADNLLLTANDFRNPKDSEVIKTLKSQENEKVKQLANLLEKCCLVDVAAVPEFSDVIASLESGNVEDLVKADTTPTPAAAAPSSGPTWWDQNESATTPSTPAAAPTPASPAPAPSAPSYATPSASAKPDRKPTAAKAPPPSMRAQQPTRPAPQPDPAPVSAPPSDPGNTKLLVAVGVGVVMVLIVIFLAAKAIS